MYQKYLKIKFQEKISETTEARRRIKRQDWKRSVLLRKKEGGNG